jgi:hypothetical protein
MLYVEFGIPKDGEETYTDSQLGITHPEWFASRQLSGRAKTVRREVCEFGTVLCCLIQ